MSVFLDAATCSLVDIYPRFTRAYCLQRQFLYSVGHNITDCMEHHRRRQP